MFDTERDEAASTSPRERRREESAAEIVDAAWELGRQEGLAGISLRALAARVGLKAPSLYGYFDSKAALYDAMFRQGYEELWASTAHFPEEPADRDGMKAAVADFVAFCVDDPVRYQLLFQRVVPGFEPSAGSFELAVAFLDRLREQLATVGVTDERAVDLWTAIVTGLTDQQISNDPGGDRWTRLTDTAVDVFCDFYGIT